VVPQSTLCWIGGSAEVSLKSDFKALLPSGKIGWPITSAVTPPGELAGVAWRLSSFFDDVANRRGKSVIIRSVHDYVRHPALPQQRFTACLEVDVLGETSNLTKTW